MADKNRINPTGPAARRKSSAREEKEKIQAKEKGKQDILRKKKLLHDEIWAIVLIAIGVFFAVSLQTESAGQVGMVVQSVLFGSFGRVAYGLPYYLILYGLLIFSRKASYMSIRSIISVVVLFLFISIMNSAFYPELSKAVTMTALRNAFEAGSQGPGVFGLSLGSFLLKYIDKTGIYIVSIVGIIITLLFIIDTPLATVFDNWKIKRTAARQIKEEQLAVNKSILKKSEEENKRTQLLEEKRKIEMGKKDKEKETQALKTTFVPEIHITGNEYKSTEIDDQTPAFTPEAIGLTSAQNGNQDAEDNKKKY